MHRAFLGASRPRLAMHRPFRATRRMSVAHRHPKRATLPSFSAHRDALAAIPKGPHEARRVLGATPSAFAPSDVGTQRLSPLAPVGF
jgi:hypothetical protein